MSKNPTKAELKAEIIKILKDANLEETAAKKVRLQLEQNLKCDLSNRKKEVDDLVMDYVNSQASDSDEDDDDEEDEDYAGNGKGKNNRKAEENSDYEEEEDEEDLSEEEKPKARKSGGKRGTPAKRGPAKKKKRTSNSDDDSDEDDEEEGSDDDYKPQAGAKGGKGGRKKRNNSDSDSGASWKRSKPAAKPKQAGGAKKSSGYTRPYTLSADLAAICGAESLPRHEVVKKIWAIIKERNLYDPKNRQYAICDADLQKVIGVKRFRTFGMLKYLKPHFKD
ncbi:uncharacterized protein LOC128309942 [Anopheles moucheti]|uniref:uncharacterized protein LOC128309942 n=1 Tax=Anopheles moucheti TaxID=186751 RepID=UPI0022F11DF6|nr:uncharacterized protein LOC128309942 [Anopheles moucheti]